MNELLKEIGKMDRTTPTMLLSSTSVAKIRSDRLIVDARLACAREIGTLQLEDPGERKLYMR